MRIVIVSGSSGSGKTIALQTLEDLDYCVDNLPFADSAAGAGDPGRGHDASAPGGRWTRNFLDEMAFPSALAELRSHGLTVDVLFLQAEDEVLLKRYSETGAAIRCIWAMCRCAR